MKNHKKILFVGLGVLAVSVVLSVIITPLSYDCLSRTWLSPEFISLIFTVSKYASIVGYVLAFVLGLAFFILLRRSKVFSKARTLGWVVLIILATLLLGAFLLANFFNCSSRCGDGQRVAIKSNIAITRDRFESFFNEQKTYMHVCNDPYTSSAFETINLALREYDTVCSLKSKVVCSSDETSYILYVLIPNKYKPHYPKVDGFWCVDSTGFSGILENAPMGSTCR